MHGRAGRLLGFAFFLEKRTEDNTLCGITGYVNLGTGPTPGLDISAAVKSLAHRGPDDTGALEITGRDGRVVGRFGHRRLSIIDLSALGRQPMSYEAGRYTVSYNGETYNFPELKRELAARGFSFGTRSDTEVVLAAYAGFGETFLEKLDAMYALALWDRDAEKLILARDPFGKKPLYWAVANGTLFFASELKSLRMLLPGTPELDPESLKLYLYLGYVPAPRTIYRGVMKLPPGSYLIADKNGTEVKPHFPLAETFCGQEYPPAFPEAAEHLDTLLADAVRKRLISDVPLGIFLSGGIDSSTIASYAASLASEEVTTFSIGFREREFDELPWAKRVARALGLRHFHETLDASAMLGIIPRIPEVLDEPIADASILPTYLLSRLTAGRVKVALGGDGADELFLGYPTYFAHILMDPFAHKSESLNARISALGALLPQRFGNYDLGYKVVKFARGLNRNRVKRHFDWMDYLARDQVREVAGLSGEVEGFFGHLEEELARGDLKGPNILDTLYLNQRYYLTESILTKVDRASMAHSLEVRCPFLDRRVVGYVNSLPLGFKLRHGLGKYILKRIMKDRIPRGVLFRKKQGFTVPLARWLNRELSGLVDRCLLDEAFLARQGLFEPEPLKDLVMRHRTKRENLWRPLWALVFFQMWYMKWVEER